ncbi:adenylate kinase [Bullifex porci]|uniref:Adenylate kinase n=1 Tax=Bullifex porci TaxID=2606638 RepID=A0A7X2PCJ6_9SPIO|nr:adenylate kinase [Bullifex porci]MDD7254894.1 adenylate kinase [Bullifex porci]MDD7589539.1 adenylate kinase [Bullifex porci]MDY2741579.1 adenylate kinase [Bullifex porci]MSU05958.1 adenylate kinase [Bullifex porci]
MNMVFLGPPGAGKGTIATQAKVFYSIPHISTGDLFRAEQEKGSELGNKVKSIIASGKLVPDEITIEVVKQRLSQDDTKNGFILDGFPRTIAQADALANIVNIDAVVNFVVDKDAVVKRISGRRFCKSTGRTYHVIYNPPKVEGIDDETGEPLYQREDDKPENVKTRLEVYDASTAPLIEYYRAKGKLVDVDASPAPEVVFDNLKKALTK